MAKEYYVSTQIILRTKGKDDVGPTYGGFLVPADATPDIIQRKLEEHTDIHTAEARKRGQELIQVTITQLDPSGD